MIVDCAFSWTSTYEVGKVRIEPDLFLPGRCKCQGSLRHRLLTFFGRFGSQNVGGKFLDDLFVQAILFRPEPTEFGGNRRFR